ncbi:hypothetical protein DPMN_057686 [Dreissena polymorpha]|uniref:Uncharacterized protein n=1 Tax=Dreissena polymorpha TaxID=45954 RepID=A0A9D4C0E5_DREPO|nr:hypothetical protein DPMN_057686 [Dreissena polymorpha]
MSRRDIPGFGFDPGFEPKPFQPQQPPPDSASIFGLISRVNQGVVSQTSKCILEQPASTQPAESAELQQAKSVAEKITMARHLPPQSVKDRAFLEAKAAVERIQKGQTLASSPTATHIKLVAQTVNPETSFRVPELPRDSSGRGPCFKCHSQRF